VLDTAKVILVQRPEPVESAVWHLDVKVHPATPDHHRVELVEVDGSEHGVVFDDDGLVRGLNQKLVQVVVVAHHGELDVLDIAAEVVGHGGEIMWTCRSRHDVHALCRSSQQNHRASPEFHRPSQVQSHILHNLGPIWIHYRKTVNISRFF
jgi:hypothetical protein